MTQLELFTESDFKEDPLEQRKRYLLNSIRTHTFVPIHSARANMSLYKHHVWCMEEMRKLDYIFHEHKGEPKCEECEYWVYTHVFLRKEKIWHCKSGFKPHNDKSGCCVDQCAMNVILSGGIK